MMRAHVRLRLPDGSNYTLGPGDVIGRTWSAALRLDDPHVSEAHALVSLRAESLLLLSLRRRFLVDGHPQEQVELRVGQRIAFSPETELLVLEVVLPEAMLGVEGDGLPTQALAGPCSVLLTPALRVVPGVSAGAAAVLWDDGEGWRVRAGDQPPRRVEAGETLSLGARTLRFVSVSLSRAGQAATRVGLDEPLHIVSFFDSVHIQRQGAAPVVLSGQQARVISELISTGAPLAWQELASQLWPEVDDRDAARRKWDVLMVRLRTRLRELGVRPDLIRPTGVGLVELVLQAGDRVEDRS